MVERLAGFPENAHAVKDDFLETLTAAIHDEEVVTPVLEVEDTWSPATLIVTYVNARRFRVTVEELPPATTEDMERLEREWLHRHDPDWDE